MTLLDVFVFVAVITAVTAGLFLWILLYVTDGPVWVVDKSVVESEDDSDD